MKKCACVLMMAALLALLPGCGGNDRDRGMNRHKDLPRAAPTENNK